MAFSFVKFILNGAECFVNEKGSLIGQAAF